jgi:hypothetical protein
MKLYQAYNISTVTKSELQLQSKINLVLCFDIFTTVWLIRVYGWSKSRVYIVMLYFTDSWNPLIYNFTKPQLKKNTVVEMVIEKAGGKMIYWKCIEKTPVAGLWKQRNF